MQRDLGQPPRCFAASEAIKLLESMMEVACGKTDGADGSSSSDIDFEASLMGRRCDL